MAAIRLLYIEDNKCLQRQLLRIFEMGALDISVDCAESAEEALPMLSKEYDCILSDYHMGEMNGLDLLCAIRNQGLEIPFILYTSDPSLKAEFLQVAGENDRFLTKGQTRYGFSEIIRNIRELV